MSIENKTVNDIFTLHEQQPTDHVWIDVRQPEEWAEGTIPGIQRIMLGDLPEQLSGLDPEKTYVMVCRSGARSGRACQMLEEAGFKKVINFQGGMMSWYGAQYPLE